MEGYEEVTLHTVLHVGGTVTVRKNDDGTFSVGPVQGPSMQVSAARLGGGVQVMEASEEEQKTFVAAAMYHILQQLVLPKLGFGRASEQPFNFTMPGGVA